MATPDEIPTDLTLEIGENLPPERFMAAARAFFGYVKEVTDAVTSEGDHVNWTVRVREGSHLIGVAPSQVSPAVLTMIYKSAESGLTMLAAGKVADAGLNDAAMGHLKVLSDMTDGSHGKPVDVKLWVLKKPIPVGPTVGQAIREDNKSSYNDYGTLEGRLKSILDQGSVQLMLRDDLLGLTLRCYVSEQLLPQAFENFRKRVEVAGLIHYRANGTPISIDVGRIEPLPDDDELPSADDVRGLLRAAG